MTYDIRVRIIGLLIINMVVVGKKGGRLAWRVLGSRKGTQPGREGFANFGLMTALLIVAGFLAVACGSGGDTGKQSSGGASSAQKPTAATAAPTRSAKEEAPKQGNITAPIQGEGTPKLQVKTVAEVTASAPGSKFLDGRHLSSGLNCLGCHGALPAEGPPKPPDTAKCLSCHGGSYESLGTKTAALGEMNPHNSHAGQTDCSNCHGVHRPFEYWCNACHTFGVPKRFQSGS